MSDESQAPEPADAGAQGDELLAPEAGALRSKAKVAPSRLERVRQERDEYRRQVDHLRRELEARQAASPQPTAVAPVPPGKVLLEQERYDELRQAKRDLVRLLRRLGRPPLGWALRRQSGYRRLRQRWLREG